MQKPQYLELVLHETWYNKSIEIGLTNIELYDKDGNVIDLTKCNIEVIQNDNVIETENLSNLYNGKYLTIESEDMWKYNYTPNIPITIRIELIPSSLTPLPPSHIKIWNYNDINLLGAGVKRLEIKYNGISISENTIKRSIGSEDCDYSVDIPLLDLINNINQISPIEHMNKTSHTVSAKDIVLSPIMDSNNSDRKSPTKSTTTATTANNNNNNRPNSSKDNELNRTRPLVNELNKIEENNNNDIESTIPIEKSPTKTIVHTPVHSNGNNNNNNNKTVTIRNNNDNNGDDNKVDPSILLDLLPKPNYENNNNNNNRRKSNTSPIISPSHNKPRPHGPVTSSSTTSTTTTNNNIFDIHKLPPSHPSNGINIHQQQPSKTPNTNNNLDSTIPLDLPKHSPTSKSSRPNTQSKDNNKKEDNSNNNNNLGGTIPLDLPKHSPTNKGSRPNTQSNNNNNNLGGTARVELPKDISTRINTSSSSSTPLKPDSNNLGSTSQLNLPKESKRLSTPVVDLPKDISGRISNNNNNNKPQTPSKRPPTGLNKPKTPLPKTPPISNCNNSNDLGKTTQLELPTESKRLITTPRVDLPKDISVKISTSPESQRIPTANVNSNPNPNGVASTPSIITPATPIVNLPREYQRLATPHLDRIATPVIDLPKDISTPLSPPPLQQQQLNNNNNISPKKRKSVSKRILSPSIPPISSPNLNETLPLFQPDNNGDNNNNNNERIPTAKSQRVPTALATPQSKPSTPFLIDIQNTPQQQQQQSQQQEEQQSLGIDIHMANTPLVNNPSQSILDNVIYNRKMIIDTIPHGHYMEIALHSTWGDPYYIGLNGIEFYDENGHPIRFRNPKNIANQNTITADPSDINVLPDYKDDPRVVTNLLDGVNYTTDDYHIWLSPYYVDKDNMIYIRFDGVIGLSMMRIWNYNKCRTHSTRGARAITVKLDNNIIYNGDIKQAPGTMANIDECRESLYFTNDPIIRNEIEQYDKAQILALDRTPTCLQEALQQFNLARPSTAEKRDVSKLQQDQQQHHRPKLNLVTFDGRPFTAVGKTPIITPGKRGVAPKVDSTPPTQKKVKMKLERTKLLCLELLENYGDKEYIGLTGIAVMKDSDTNLQKLTINMISSSSADMDSATPMLFNLVNNINKTTNPHNMCYFKLPQPEDKEKTIRIYIDFRIADFIGGLLIWNYNKSEDDLPICVKRMNVYCDEKLVSPPGGYILRPAYGFSSGFDYCQRLYFHSPLIDYSIPRDITINGKVTTSQYYTTVLHPFGTSIKINLNESHGDPFYIGLNEIDFYDINNNKINIKENQIFASPYSVNILPQSKDDLRIPSNLVDGKISSDKHSWLSPLARTINEDISGGIGSGGEGKKYTTNSLYFLFDKPIILSYIKIWNYHKTPSRGAKDIEIWMDNMLLYKGWLNDSNTTGSNGQTIVFTNNFDILSKEKNNIYPPNDYEQAVILMDNGSLMASSAPLDNTSHNVQFRPTTSLK